MVATNNENLKEVTPSPAVNLPSEPNRLCMDAIADAWSKQTGQDPSVFEKQIASELHMENASHQDLDKAYMEQIKAQEIKKLGPTAGELTFQEAKIGLACKE